MCNSKKHSGEKHQKRLAQGRLKITKSLKKLIGRLPQYNKYKSWYPSKYDKQIEMRSGWEVAFALWLDQGEVEWIYEPRWFNVGKGRWKGVSYTPDFYLPDQGVYIELKGRFTKANERKMEAFYKQYPDVKLWMFHGKHLAEVLEFHPNKAA
jgi:hypothetical protein